ncbi:MAG: peptidase C1 [Bacteroidetes bacterium RIFCSPLOWO2_12_FULL_37_12]|nr:MAG: peptidase C1 [Bacteroidetes bacterium RIFCSPLOWO2_12_FULL_37_12]
MKTPIITLALLIFSATAFSQGQLNDKAVYRNSESGYYKNVIMKEIKSFNNKKDKDSVRRDFVIDLSGKNLPTDPDQYKKVWHTSPVSQGNTNTCWCYATSSFYESEIYRLTGKQVKLSEMYFVYWEYIERTKYFIRNRGDMSIGEGSETNALARTMKKYGAVPFELYTGKKEGEKFHTHAKMFDEIKDFLRSMKYDNNWNEESALSTVKSILTFYMGEPPTKVKEAGKDITPQEYMEKVLKINPDNYVNLMSLMVSPYYSYSLYDVPDNWWRSSDYLNVPLDDYMNAVKNAVKNGFTISIGGDVSEPGIDRKTQVAVVPTFDIAHSNIDESARQMRFNNGSTTDDHAMHVVGIQEREDGSWFLIKDSGSGSRNCGEGNKCFGYFFFHEDFIKLKMMTLTLHKDAVKDLLGKVKK